MPNNDSSHSGKTQPLSPNLRVRKLLLIVAGSRTRFMRDWQARADRLMQRAIELSWMGRLAAYHRAQQRYSKLNDWRDQWRCGADGAPLPIAFNAAIALREHPQLSGRVILINGELTAIRDGRRRPLNHDDIARTVAFLQKLGLPDLSDEECLRALAVVAAENRDQ